MTGNRFLSSPGHLQNVAASSLGLETKVIIAF